jgi:tetratricopeptide (TPR) repeat protein
MAVLLLAFALAAPPEPLEVRARYRACLETDGEKGVDACLLSLKDALTSPHRALALGLLADRLASLERWDEALAADRESVKLRPDDSLAQRRLGETLLYALGRAEEALGPLREAVALEPGDAQASASLGAALNALSRFPESVKALEAAEESDPNFFARHPAARETLEASRRGETWPKPAVLAAPEMLPSPASP